MYQIKLKNMNITKVSKFFSICLFIILSKCGLDTKQESIIGNSHSFRKNYYASGEIESTCEYLDDSVRHGEAIQYFKNGSVKIELEYSNNKKNGDFQEFYENGRVKRVGKFFNDLQVDSALWYWENGNIKANAYFINGIRTGVSCAYDESGNILTYIFENEIGEITYKSDYSHDGHLVEENGVGFPNILVSKFELNLNEEVEIEVNIIQPPHAKSEILHVSEITDSNGDILKSTPVEYSDIGRYYFRKSWSELGKKSIGLALEIESDDANAKTFYAYEIELEVR